MAAAATASVTDASITPFLFQYGGAISVPVKRETALAFQMLSDMLAHCDDDGDNIIPCQLASNSNGQVMFTVQELELFFQVFESLELTKETTLLKTYENIDIPEANSILQENIMPNVIKVMQSQSQMVTFELALKFLVLANALHHEGYMNALAYYIATHYRQQFISSLNPST